MAIDNNNWTPENSLRQIDTSQEDILLRILYSKRSYLSTDELFVVRKKMLA